MYGGATNAFAVVLCNKLDVASQTRERKQTGIVQYDYNIDSAVKQENPFASSEYQGQVSIGWKPKHLYIYIICIKSNVKDVDLYIIQQSMLRFVYPPQLLAQVTKDINSNLWHRPKIS